MPATRLNRTRPATLVALVVALILTVPGACARASAAGLLHGCPDTSQARCGTIRVPLDRSDPARGTIPIFFRFVAHAAKGPGGDPIFTTEGGPGYAVNENDWEHGYLDFAFAKLHAHHDLVFIDQRGTGRSGPINCPSVQGGIAGPVFYRAVARCAARLGPAANDYGSGNVALDIDAVRAALSIKHLEFYGASYAGVDGQAYAARFGSHLDALVLDSPVKIVGLDDLSHTTPPAMARAVRLVCARSASCSAAQRTPDRLLAWLARRLRRQPVVGTAIDSQGDRVHMRVTESVLAWRLLQDGDYPLTVDAEVTAAAAALRAGDDVPLLRLATETAGPLIGPFAGDSSSAPSAFSGGDNYARYCTDATFPWSKDAALPARRRQFAAAKAVAPATAFAPFSADAWLAGPPVGPLGPDQCITWPAPATTVPAAVPAGTHFPSVPTLVLSGDLDTTVPSADARAVARLFPKATFVELAESGHHTVFSFQNACAQALVQRFLQTRRVGDTSCARHPRLVFPALGAFPLTARRTSPATVTSRTRDRSTPFGRRVAAAAALSLRDVIDHAQSGPHGVGLRGGTFAGAFGKSALNLTLSGVRFTRDVAISGHAMQRYVDGRLTASLHVSGPAGQSGHLRVSGLYLAPGAGRLAIAGRLKGRRVALAIPAT